MKDTLTLAPFPGAGLSAEMRRERIAADFRGRRASIGLWLAVSFTTSLALWAAYTQLAAMEAALKCAAGV